ncbi:MAG TPA: nucleotide exchange factor GrpE [Actinomycetota bacterium]|nr:nucleotide exchange factor GrpE [Actinomycetota bacterium]
MTDRKDVKRVTIKDKRHSAPAETGSTSLGAHTNPQRSSGGDDPVSAQNVAGTEAGYLADLQRVQAEFENYRKRMMREQSDTARRATSKLVERLLPVLDNFELAIAHGEGGEGVALVYRELKTVLEAAGLEEIPAEGQAFDPMVHEAIMSREDESVTQETVTEVHRAGYRLGDQLLRAATVVVARPPEPQASAEEVAEA